MNNYNNKEYEKALLGCMLLDNSIIDDVIAKIKTEMFYFPFCQVVFNAITNLSNTNGVINLVTILAIVGQNKTAEVAELTNIVPSSSQWEFYAENIFRMYLARKFQKELIEKAEKVTPENVEQSVHDLDGSLCGYMSESSKEASNTNSMINNFIDRQKELMERAAQPYLGIHTGWDNLSAILDGLQLGELMMLGARPSIGKTAFALQMAINLCDQKIPTCMFSLEMGEKAIMDRMMAMISGIPIAKIRSGYVMKYSAMAGKVNCALEKLYTYQFNVYYNLRNVDEIISAIKLQAKRFGTKVFFVDHLTLIHCPGSTENRNTQLDHITQKFHALCQELNIAIICLCQLRRDSEGKRPSLADLRDSGTIEQNTDTCVFLHRDRKTSETQTEIKTEVLVAKNRNGDCGMAKMVFIPSLTKFIEDLT